MLVVVALLALVSIRSPIYAAVAIASYLGIIVTDMPYNETDHVLWKRRTATGSRRRRR